MKWQRAVIEGRHGFVHDEYKAEPVTWPDCGLCIYVWKSSREGTDTCIGRAEGFKWGEVVLFEERQI